MPQHFDPRGQKRFNSRKACSGICFGERPPVLLADGNIEAGEEFSIASDSKSWEEPPPHSSNQTVLLKDPPRIGAQVFEHSTRPN